MGFPSITNRLPPPLKQIKQDLKAYHQPISEADLAVENRQLIHRIKNETAKRNLNNITRTEAYLDYYKQFPEIHWAFLGHMVSRNGGWNMTDLKGDLLAKILSEEEQTNFFQFLERGNWLIFQDVFPQLLLYEESKKRNTNLFYLLSCFGVSKFMEVIWNYFFGNKDTYLLAIALVINEQSYLEKRVMQHAHYKNTVLETIEFKLQDILNLNEILFPYKEGNKVKISGQSIHQFASLHERILLGKRLYQLLFDKENHPKFFTWASANRHTGSRKDYWPQLFNDINESVPGKAHHRRIKNCQLKPGSSRIYSPRLEYAWEKIDHEKAEKGDWYSNWKVIDYLKPYHQTVDGDIYDEYCETLERIELAILAKETFSTK
ncbi:DUF2515 domain-containing protein [Aquibacillus albus]|uniref:DUF2515 domain-containing protein n=1 Tax=Aquibacillus albus TaxID=1168171 RepID=A0ABS2MXG9_9BACI|nr:DUF2515 domain-containing protein [Aquibacillus albus]MBM7570598.1 hypothetical protein [Aquibacillus albus]